MNLRKKAFEGVAWTVTQSLGTQLLSLAVFLILARLLDPEAFGLVAIATALVAFMQVFVGLGLSSRIVQTDALEPEHLDTAFWINVLVGIILVLAIWTLSERIADLFNRPDISQIIRWLSLVLLISAVCRVHHSMLLRKLEFRSLAFRTLAAEPIGGCFGVLMAFYGFGVWSLVAKQLITSAIAALILWCLSKWRPRLRFSRRHARDLLGFGVPVLGVRLSGFFSSRFNILLIGYFLDAVAVGYFTVAGRLYEIMRTIIGDTVARVTVPLFSRIQKDHEKLREVLYTATQMTALIAVPGFLGMSAVEPELVPMLLGEKWKPIVSVVQVLAFLYLLNVLHNFKESVMMAVGKPSWRLGLRMLVMIGNIVGFLVAVRWGLVAVATAYVVVGYTLAPLWIWLVRRLIQIDLRVYLRGYLAPIFGSSVMLGVVVFVKTVMGTEVPDSARLSVVVVAGVLSYGLVVRYVYPAVFEQALLSARNLVFAFGATKKR